MPEFRVPLSVYVLFHEECPESAALAKALFTWLRMQDDEGRSNEAGLPVWYRCRIAKEEGIEEDRAGVKKANLSPGIQWKQATLNVVVVLVSDRMVDDIAWRRALQADIVEYKRRPLEGERAPLILPVGVDDSLRRLVFLTQDTQAIAIGAPMEQGVSFSDKDPAFKRRARLLRRGVTEAIARALRTEVPVEAAGKTEAAASPGGPGEEEEPAPRPIEVFISHAKRDGRMVAESVRDRLAGHSQLKAWYDANELPPGYAWDHPMIKAVENDTAALVSVVSDAYATRFWCREEVRLARTPRRIGPAGCRVWAVRPAVGVNIGGTGERRPMAPLSNVVHIGWEGMEANGDAVEELVDRLLLEVLVSEFYRRVCLEIDRSINRDLKIVLLTFPPTPWTLARLTGDLSSGAATGSPPVLPTHIAYPGFGLRAGELLELQEIAKDLGYPHPQGGLFVTLEELIPEGPLHRSIDPSLAPPPDHPDLIAVLSAGGELKEMAAWGASTEHADDFLVRVSHRLLRRGWRLAYGGTLSGPITNITESLIDAAQTFAEESALEWYRLRIREHDERAPPAEAKRMESPPLVNYVPWPNQRHLTIRRKADLAGVCKFDEVPPDGASKAVLKELVDTLVKKKPMTRADQAKVAWLGAQALTKMRVLSAEKANLRVVVGGKVYGWSGWLPGIAEELEATLRRDAASDPKNRPYPHPFLLIGGLGGCAGELARYLQESKPKADWPSAFTLDGAIGDKRNADKLLLLLDHPDARKEAYARFQRMKDEVEHFRKHLWRLAPKDPVFKGHARPTREEFDAVLDGTSETRTLNLVATVADGIRAKGGKS